MPQLVMIAGPHGSGKTHMMRGPDGERLRVGRYVDPQDIFEGLRSHYATGEASNIPAKDFAARAIERAFTVNFEHIKKRKDLTAVCSLGSVTDMDLIDAARQQGYYISFYYTKFIVFILFFSSIYSIPTVTNPLRNNPMTMTNFMFYSILVAAFISANLGSLT